MREISAASEQFARRNHKRSSGRAPRFTRPAEATDRDRELNWVGAHLTRGASGQSVSGLQVVTGNRKWWLAAAGARKRIGGAVAGWECDRSIDRAAGARELVVRTRAIGSAGSLLRSMQHRAARSTVAQFSLISVSSERARDKNASLMIAQRAIALIELRSLVQTAFGPERAAMGITPTERAAGRTLSQTNTCLRVALERQTLTNKRPRQIHLTSDNFLFLFALAIASPVRLAPPPPPLTTTATVIARGFIHDTANWTTSGLEQRPIQLSWKP